MDIIYGYHQPLRSPGTEEHVTAGAVAGVEFHRYFGPIGGRQFRIEVNYAAVFHTYAQIGLVAAVYGSFPVFRNGTPISAVC